MHLKSFTLNVQMMVYTYTWDEKEKAEMYQENNYQGII